MTIRQDDHGASGMVAFMIAGFVFVGSVGAVLYTSDKVDGPGIDDGTQTGSLERQAGSLVDLLVGSPGLSALPGDWVSNKANVEALVRLGLENPNYPGYFDFAKFQNLRLAPLDEDADGNGIIGTNETADDGYVNYVEAVKAMLGDSGLDFHIRSYPNLKKVQEILAEGGEKDENLRVTYIGDATQVTTGGNGSAVPPGTGITLTGPTCSVNTTAYPKMYRISMSVLNGGTATTQFEGIFDIAFSNGTSEYQKHNTFTVAPSASVTVFADVAATSGRSCVGAAVDFSLYDAVATKLVQNKTTLSGPSGATAATRGLTVDTGSESYRPTQAVLVEYGGLNLAWKDPLILTVCPGETECSTPTYRYPSSGTFEAAKGNGGNPRELTIPANTFVAGEYTIRLYDASNASTSLRATERLLVSAAVPGAYVPPSSGGTTTTVPGSSMQAEVGYLEELVLSFCPTYYNSQTSSPLPAIDWNRDGVAEGTDNYAGRCAFKSSVPGLSPAQPGDVFPQDKQALKGNLERRLLQLDGITPRYDITNVLVVGSNVDHNVMTSGDVKNPIDKWVRGGGTLIVFGSADQQVQWLQPIFKASIDASSGGIAVPDRSHPVLHTGDDLDVDSYDARGRVWDLKDSNGNSYASFFTNVVTDEAGRPTLAISDPGTIGNGTVILTTYLPYDLNGDGMGGSDAAEGMRFMNNVLMQGYRDLFLDYGPVIPESDHDVIPAVRTRQICYPPFDDNKSDTNACPPEARVSLDVIVYVF